MYCDRCKKPIFGASIFSNNDQSNTNSLKTHIIYITVHTRNYKTYSTVFILKLKTMIFNTIIGKVINFSCIYFDLKINVLWEFGQNRFSSLDATAGCDYTYKLRYFLKPLFLFQGVVGNSQNWYFQRNIQIDICTVHAQYTLSIGRPTIVSMRKKRNRIPGFILIW